MSVLHQNQFHKNARALYQVVDNPRNVFEALQSTQCDMCEGAIERELEALPDYGTLEYGTMLLTHIPQIGRQLPPPV